MSVKCDNTLQQEDSMLTMAGLNKCNCYHSVKAFIEEIEGKLSDSSYIKSPKKLHRVLGKARAKLTYLEMDKEKRKALRYRDDDIAFHAELERINKENL